LKKLLTVRWYKRSKIAYIFNLPGRPIKNQGSTEELILTIRDTLFLYFISLVIVLFTNITFTFDDKYFMIKWAERFMYNRER
jgi:hypothetical protein